MRKLCYVGLPHIYERLEPGDVYELHRETDDSYIFQYDSNLYDKSQFFEYEISKCVEDFDWSRDENYYGDWRIPELDSSDEIPIRLRRINPLLTENNIIEVDFNDIQWFGFDLPSRITGENCICCGGERTKKADLSKLGILLDGTTTYSGRRYRSMDGRHRIEKLRSMGFTRSKFYVLNFAEIKNYFV